MYTHTQKAEQKRCIYSLFNVHLYSIHRFIAIPIATPCSGRGEAEYANSSPKERVNMSVSAIRALQYDLQITGHYNLPI
jgi:hypothetical protein